MNLSPLLPEIYNQVLNVFNHVVQFTQTHKAILLKNVHPNNLASAENLLAYMGLRQLDIRKLQIELGQNGFSSLGRSEGHVISGLFQLLQRINCGQDMIPEEVTPKTCTMIDYGQAEALLRTHTRNLFGQTSDERIASIMVTTPDGDIPQVEWFIDLIMAGMNIIRINTAYGDIGQWKLTAERARLASECTKREVRILIDLQGPKIRTTQVKPGPRVLRLRPEKDAYGRVQCALRVQLIPDMDIGGGPHLVGNLPCIHLPAPWISGFRVGDTIRTRDTRDRKRVLRITQVMSHFAVAEVEKTIFLSPETPLIWKRRKQEMGRSYATQIPQQEGFIQLQVGDTFYLVLDSVECIPGEKSPLDTGWIVPPRIGIEAEEMRIELMKGQRVLLDDGKVEAYVESIHDGLVLAKVIHTAKERVRLRSHKGINFPESFIQGPILGQKDSECLREVLQIADMVGLSFVRHYQDLHDALQAIAKESPGKFPGIVVKLETGQAFSELPRILLEAMSRYPVGVMIARGDLAVEVGHERLAELQQEILWFCEAAHLPVIWATQVLDRLVHTGIPTRAEITDASMAVQAECVMLNKGPYILQAIKSLDEILRKMEQHQSKKRHLFRPLKVSFVELEEQEVGRRQ